MMLTASSTDIPDVRVIEPVVYRDGRGFFTEAYHREKLLLGGIDFEPLQLNRSLSPKGVLRGLHCQMNPPQAKLVFVSSGTIFDVGVDLRRGSPTFAKWTGTILSAQNFRQLFLPVGFVHGFLVLSEEAEVLFLTSAPYAPKGELMVVWNDPQLNIRWPIDSPILSQLDAAAPRLEEILDRLPSYAVRVAQPSSRGSFISYSGRDAEFAGKLYHDLMEAGIPCWWAPEDMSPGDRMRETFQAAIRARSSFLLVLSTNSLRSDWVHGEVEAALEWERESGTNVVRPVSVDKAVFETAVAWACHLRRTRHIGDFSEWRDEVAYRAALEKLVSTLRGQKG